MKLHCTLVCKLTMLQFVRHFYPAGKIVLLRGRLFKPIFSVCFISFFATVSVAAFAADKTFPLNLEPQPLYSALSRLSQIAQFQITGNSKYFKGHTIAPLKGNLTAREAVAELLKGTDIRYEWEDDTTLLILGRVVPRQPAPSKKSEIEEITVVGSHIRGANSAAPVFQFTRKDIENSGLVTTQDFVGSLPQMFGGGAAEGAIASIQGAGADTNIANASGVNLRGLGNDSTLTLLNGRRMAPAGFGHVVDISAIPLNAIERIDVLTDGASAIYGADAVGGVVNITLRKNYEGSETRVGYGDATSGSSEYYRLNHTFGTDWQFGSALFSYGYHKRANLDTEDRAVAETAEDPSDLLGKNIQQDILFSMNQQLGQQADVYVDLLHSARETKTNNTDSVETIVGVGDVKQTGLTTGVLVDINSTWQIDAGMLYSRSSTLGESRGEVIRSTKAQYDISQIDAKVDGDLFEVWGREVKLALGGHYRREVLMSESTLSAEKENMDRNISAIFAELFIPIVGDGNALPGIERLELTLAGRHEEYSDFGGTTNPKIGLLWSPIPDVDFRATYGTSFRAPLLYELSEAIIPTGSFTIYLPDANGAMIPTLLILGHNSTLRSEDATTWTFGMDFNSTFWPGLSAAVTYFDIDYTGRIQTVISANKIPNALVDPAYAPIVQRGPDMALIDYWMSRPNFNNTAGLEDFSEIDAVVDNRLQNISLMHERGVDFNIGYSLESAIGAFDFRLGGTYLFELESKLTTASPSMDILDTTYNPVDLKLRNSVSWRLNPLTATVFINYIDGYKDTRFEQERDIDAWTTVDINAGYLLQSGSNSWLQGTRISLSIQNVFDEEPPFVANEQGYNFDATNANALGRRLFLEVSRRW